LEKNSVLRFFAPTVSEVAAVITRDPRITSPMGEWEGGGLSGYVGDNGGAKSLNYSQQHHHVRESVKVCPDRPNLGIADPLVLPAPT
jgi:hypothetical protein